MCCVFVSLLRCQVAFSKKLEMVSSYFHRHLVELFNPVGSFRCAIAVVFSRSCTHCLLPCESKQWPWCWNVMRTACSNEHLRLWRHAQKLCCKSGLPLGYHEFYSFILQAGGTKVSPRSEMIPAVASVKSVRKASFSVVLSVRQSAPMEQHDCTGWTFARIKIWFSNRPQNLLCIAVIGPFKTVCSL
jgi:hypothetical protein